MSKFNQEKIHSSLRLLIADARMHGNDHSELVSSFLAENLSNIVPEGAVPEDVECFCVPDVQTRYDFKIAVGIQVMTLSILYKSFTLKVGCSALGVSAEADPFLCMSATPRWIVAVFDGVDRTFSRNEINRLSDAMNLVRACIDKNIKLARCHEEFVQDE